MKPIRTLLATLLVLVSGLAVIVGPASPAQAKCPGDPDCFPKYYQVHIWWPDPPCFCPELAIDYLRDPREYVAGIAFDTERGLPDGFVDQVAQGLTLLGQAARTRDQAVAARLHEQGIATFLAAARNLNGERLGLQAVGVIDVGKYTFGPRAIGWLQTAGENLVTGLNGLADGTPLPADVAALDAASAGLARGGAL